ncbi:hypothetical protein HK102_000397 [Quaeritorhiza haematococci]|nr:hypothetical protein HK102_000397 [Quaeritorhiza haematococci]
MAVDHKTTYTYEEMDAAANRIAWWAMSPQVNLKPFDVVALLMENRPEYLMMTMGLAKAGITIALINTNLTGELLLHAINVSGAKVAIVSWNKRDNWATLEKYQADHPSSLSRSVHVWWYAGEGQNVPDDDDNDQSAVDAASKPSGSFPFPLRGTGTKPIIFSHWKLNLAVLNAQRSDRPSREVRQAIDARTPLFFIFTSGTTGPSKAAKFSHRRFIGAAVTWAGPSSLRLGDRYYITLPLYHGNAGVVAVAPCYFLGNPIVLREKFSASNFFKDIRQYNCVATIYIGELWRYLYVQPQQPNEYTPRFSPLRVIIGNGLRSDIWTTITQRFHITQVIEHYGSTEMPGDAVLNYFNKPGSCGFLPPAVARQKTMTGEGGVLVRYNIEDDVVERDPTTGRCIPCEAGEVGEMIMRLPGGKYDGYVGEAATRRKLYQDVFEEGDTWWSSGDLLKTDEMGFFYFVDRAGDSFRWKGENVATSEVAKVVAGFPSVLEANVYGVRIPNTDGRAGMASIVWTSKTTSTFDWASFTTHIQALPTYARPLLIRLRHSTADAMACSSPTGTTAPSSTATDKKSKEFDKTSTLKFQKFKYVQQGFDPEKCEGDEVWMWDVKASAPGGGKGWWVQVDAGVLAGIQGGKYRF